MKRQASALAASAASAGVSQHVCRLALALVPLTMKDHAHRTPLFSVRISTLQPLYSKRRARFLGTLIGVCILTLASDRPCSFTLLSGIRRGTGRPCGGRPAPPPKSKETIVDAGLPPVCILEYIGKGVCWPCSADALFAQKTGHVPSAGYQGQPPFRHGRKLRAMREESNISAMPLRIPGFWKPEKCE